MTKQPDGAWINLCDDDNVNHCPEVRKLADGSVAIRNTRTPGEVVTLSARDYELLLANGGQALTA
jgi:hypothetical protein